MSIKYNIPIWEKLCLSVEEMAAYSSIGENKLRQLIDSDRYAGYLLWNGKNVKIKRKEFEKYIESISYI